MSPSHHIKQSRSQLKFATRDTVAGDHAAAARSLARATSHAATAIGSHWNLLVRGRPTRRRLQFALDEIAHRGIITHSLAGVMRQAYDLPNRMADAMAAAPDAESGRREVIRLLRRTRTRARRLLRRILTAMAADPNPPAFAEIRARAAPYPSRPSPSSSATHGSSAHFTRTGYCRTTASAASSPSSAHTAGGSGLPSSKSRNSCDKSAAPSTVRPSTPSASSDADAWMMLQPSARALTPAITAPAAPAAVGPSC